MAARKAPPDSSFRLEKKRARIEGPSFEEWKLSEKVDSLNIYYGDSQSITLAKTKTGRDSIMPLHLTIGKLDDEPKAELVTAELAARFSQDPSDDESLWSCEITHGTTDDLVMYLTQEAERLAKLSESPEFRIGQFNNPRDGILHCVPRNIETLELDFDDKQIDVDEILKAIENTPTINEISIGVNVEFDGFSHGFFDNQHVQRLDLIRMGGPLKTGLDDVKIRNFFDIELIMPNVHTEVTWQGLRGILEAYKRYEVPGFDWEFAVHGEKMAPPEIWKMLLGDAVKEPLSSSQNIERRVKNDQDKVELMKIYIEDYDSEGKLQTLAFGSAGPCRAKD